jgi:hypothetical protein
MLQCWERQSPDRRLENCQSGDWRSQGRNIGVPLPSVLANNFLGVKQKARP